MTYEEVFERWGRMIPTFDFDLKKFFIIDEDYKVELIPHIRSPQGRDCYPISYNKEEWSEIFIFYKGFEVFHWHSY